MNDKFIRIKIRKNGDNVFFGRNINIIVSKKKNVIMVRLILENM